MRDSGYCQGCGSSADGVMGMVMGMKGTVKGCGSSWNRVIVMKGTSKGCGSSADGVTGFGQIVRRMRTKRVVLGTG